MARHRCRILVVPLLFLVAFGGFASAQDKMDGSPADIAAIKQIFADFYTAFSRQDAEAITKTFAPDGDFTNMFGIHVHGREAIQQRFTALFGGNLKSSNRTDTVRNIQFYTPDVAFV